MTTTMGNGYIRKEVYSIKFVEELLEKAMYSKHKDQQMLIRIGDELIHKYDLKCDVFFSKGYSCFGCGLTGTHFALENLKGKQKLYSLNLYAKNSYGGEILITTFKNSDDDFIPLCWKCYRKNKGLQRGEKKKKAISSDGKTSSKLIKLFDGSVDKNLWIVGYCNNVKHKGLIDMRLAEEHNCVEKHCPLFEIIDISYWDEAKKNRKSTKHTENEINIFIRSLFIPYKIVHVTSIRREVSGIVVSYISDGDCDLSDIIDAVYKKYTIPVYLKRVKTSENVIDKLIRDS